MWCAATHPKATPRLTRFQRVPRDALARSRTSRAHPNPLRLCRRSIHRHEHSTGLHRKGTNLTVVLRTQVHTPRRFLADLESHGDACTLTDIEHVKG